MLGVNNIEGELGDLVLYTQNTANLSNLLFGLVIGEKGVWIEDKDGKTKTVQLTCPFVRKFECLDEYERTIHTRLLNSYKRSVGIL